MLRLDFNAQGFANDFAELVNARRVSSDNVSQDVAKIIAAVRERGDRAVRDYTSRFDGHDLDAGGWQIDPALCRTAREGLDKNLREALELAAERIRIFHEKQKPQDSETVDSIGARVGSRWNAVDAAGVYVPGGRAAYPSSVLMNAIPAKVAGVQRLVMVTPTMKAEINPLVMAAAAIAGVDEIWRIGGAQAIAALAFGTDRIRPVDVITGPGNAWVAEAKRQLYGVVGIDMVAGPREIVVVADGMNSPEWTAADLMSQAEHDPTSQSILITDDAQFADAVVKAVENLVGTLSTGATARTSWATHGAVIIVPNFEVAIPLINPLAPEHLQLAIENPQSLFAKVRHAGSVFLGRMTPEAVGDYVAGPNHVLPTGRRARFASGLSVTDFMKRTSFLELNDAALQAVGPAAIALAEAEGLPAHALSIRQRL